MLRCLAVLLIVSVHLDLNAAQIIEPIVSHVLTPPYFNIATGKLAINNFSYRECSCVNVFYIYIYIYIYSLFSGKKIDSTATCGEDDSQVFCKLTGGPNEYEYNENLYQGQFCDVCEINNPEKAHPIKYAIDGTEKWWQSPPLSQGSEYNRINVTIHLGQVMYLLSRFFT